MDVPSDSSSGLHLRGTTVLDMHLDLGQMVLLVAPEANPRTLQIHFPAIDSARALREGEDYSAEVRYDGAKVKP